MNVLVFDIWGDYGHFKVPYTTTSPLTFPVPSKTAVYGMLGAILGLDKHSYLQQFQNDSCSVAISLKKPFKKTYISENLLHTKNVVQFARMKKKPAPHSPTRIEFLKDPKFRLYVTLKEEQMFNQLHNHLQAHTSVYSLSLGLSECIANYKFIGMYKTQEKNKPANYIDMRSIVPFSSISSNKDIDIVSEGKRFLKIHLPLEFKPDRELIHSMDFLIESNGYTIQAKPDTYQHVSELDENIILV